jgi:hypothetical protein
VISANAVSGSYQSLECSNLSRLDLSQILPAYVTWSSDPLIQHNMGQAPGAAYSLLTATRFEESKSGRVIIKDFATLADNWDGYGASPISKRIRDNALRFVDVIEGAPFSIPRPGISPKPTGTISFEWETPRVEAYLEIGNTRYSGFLKANQQQPTFLEGRADFLDQQVLTLIHRALSFSAQSIPVTEIRTWALWHELLAA